MAEKPLLCDYPNCGQLAQSFALVPSRGKTKACAEHSLALTRKKSVLFDISSYALIDSAKDVPEYERRRSEATVGIARTGEWEERCERDWEEVQRKIERAEKTVLEGVKRGFLEIRGKAEMRYEEFRRNLEGRRNCYEKLMAEWYYQMMK